MGLSFAVVFETYLGAIEAMRGIVAPATKEQRRLAATTQCNLPSDVPLLVAAAYLHDHLDAVINGRPQQTRPAWVRQLTFLGALASTEIPIPLTMRVASAWIDYFLTLRSIEYLNTLQLVAGDQVALSHEYTDRSTGERYTWEDEVMVSSIGSNGLVYFKGGNGQCAYPHRLRRLQ